MTDIVKSENNSMIPINGDDREFAMTMCSMTENMVNNIAASVNNIASTAHDIAITKAQVEMESRRLEHVFDCLMLKAQKDVTIYRETLPILELNFTKMQNRLDTLMDKALDLICGDVSEASLARQEMVMTLISDTNNTLNNLIGKLLPTSM